MESVAAEEEVAIAVLDHLARLGIIAPAEASQYQVGELPRASATADDWIRKELGPKGLSDDRRNQEAAWSSMYDALVGFERESGHCQVPADLCVDGVDLRRWVVKQRGRFRRDELPLQRVERLEAIPSWSFRGRFWTGFDLYASWLAGSTDQEQSALAWATNVRMRRLALQAKGSDFSSDKLQALADLPGWHWSPRDAELDRKISVLRDFVANSGRTIADIKQRDRWGTDPIGTWINTWRTNPHRLTLNARQLLEELPGWSWSKRSDIWDTTFAALRTFAATHGHVAPSLTSTDEHERALARWKRNNKNRKRGRTDPQSQNLRRLLARYGERLP